jgi:hypothetical protein
MCLSGQWNATLGFLGFATVNVDIRVTVIQEYAVPRKGTTLANPQAGIYEETSDRFAWLRQSTDEFIP